MVKVIGFCNFCSVVNRLVVCNCATQPAQPCMADKGYIPKFNFSYSDISIWCCFHPVSLSLTVLPQTCQFLNYEYFQGSGSTNLYIFCKHPPKYSSIVFFPTHCHIALNRGYQEFFFVEFATGIAVCPPKIVWKFNKHQVQVGWKTHTITLFYTFPWLTFHWFSNFYYWTIYQTIVSHQSTWSQLQFWKNCQFFIYIVHLTHISWKCIILKTLMDRS